MGVHPIPPIPQKKESALMHSEGEEADPKRRMKLFVRVIILIVVLVILFAPVWEVGPVYSVTGTDIERKTDGLGNNYTIYSVFILDHGVGGWYGVEVCVNNHTGQDFWHFEPYESKSIPIGFSGMYPDEFSYEVIPPEGKPRKSIFQMLVGL